MIQRTGYVVAAALAAGAVGLALASGTVSTPYKIDMIAIVLVLAGLPWLARGRGLFGPAGAGRAVRFVRVGGYILVCALVLVAVGVLRVTGHKPPARPVDPGFSQTSEDIYLSVLFFLLVSVYAAGLLALTARRTWVRTGALGSGAAFGGFAGVVLCALTPSGAFLLPAGSWQLAYRVGLLVAVAAPPIAAALISARRARVDGASLRSRIGTGMVAGLVAGATAAVVLTVVTLASMLLFSPHVALVSDPGPYPGPAWAAARTIGSASGTLLFMVMSAAPVVGIVLGAIGGTVGGAVGRALGVTAKPRPGTSERFA